MIGDLKKTAIFWDYENVPFSSGDLTNFLNDFEEIKKKIAEGSYLRCFGDWKSVPESTQTEIRQSGFELIQVPQTQKNACDSAITISALNVYHQTNYQDFILISADGDFTALLMDLMNKGVKISIIARKKNISKDLRQYCNELFYLTSKGNLFNYVLKEREDILNLLENSLKDAQKAFDSLIQRLSEKDIQIFSIENLKKAYLSLENYDISPLILGQLISLEEFLQLFVKAYGYGHSEKLDFICKHPSESKKSIKELAEDVQLPNVKKIRIPMGNIPQSGLRELIKEFTSNDIFEVNGEIEQDGKGAQKETDIVSMPVIQKKEYTSAIAKTIRNMTNGIKSPGQIKLNNLNTQVCEFLGVLPSKRIYKELGFPSFKAAVESAKGHLGRKVKLEGDTITF